MPPYRTTSAPQQYGIDPLVVRHLFSLPYDTCKPASRQADYCTITFSRENLYFPMHTVAPYRHRYIISTDTSAGDTPLMRDA